MTMINVPQKCRHPGCFVPIYDHNDFMFLPVVEIEKQLGRKVEEKDIKDFPVHVVHGGTTYESAVLFLNTFYQGKPLLIEKPKTPAPMVVAKDPIAVVKDRANALNVRFGLNPKQMKKVVAKVRTEGTDIKQTMAKIAKNARRYAASKAKSAAQPAA